MSNMYKGEIYKYKNLRNLSMQQMYPDSTKLKQAQDSIEKRLASFDSNIWVPSREELQRRREIEDSIEAAKNPVEYKDNNDNKKNEKRSSVRSSRAKNKTKENSSKKQQPKVKKEKSSVKKSSSNATRSVRRRR